MGARKIDGRAAAANRNRPARFDLFDFEQARFGAFGRWRVCRRLGRSALADFARVAAARLSGAGFAAFLFEFGRVETAGEVDFSHLEFFAREEFNRVAKRRMAVLRPLKIVIENMDENETLTAQMPENPEDPTAGKRELAIGREVFIEADDFCEDPPRGYFRLHPGGAARLARAFAVECVGEDVAADGERVLRCRRIEAEGRKIKGILHWVCARRAVDFRARLFDRLFAVKDPAAELRAGRDLADLLNPDSLCEVDAKGEPTLLEDARKNETVQFMRLGYFCPDRGRAARRPVFNRATTLRDTWAKIAARQK